MRPVPPERRGGNVVRSLPCVYVPLNMRHVASPIWGTRSRRRSLRRRLHVPVRVRVASPRNVPMHANDDDIPSLHCVCAFHAICPITRRSTLHARCTRRSFPPPPSGYSGGERTQGTIPPALRVVRFSPYVRYDVIPSTLCVPFVLTRFANVPQGNIPLRCRDELLYNVYRQNQYKNSIYFNSNRPRCQFGAHDNFDATIRQNANGGRRDDARQNLSKHTHVVPAPRRPRAPREQIFPTTHARDRKFFLVHAPRCKFFQPRAPRMRTNPNTRAMPKYPATSGPNIRPSGHPAWSELRLALPPACST